MSYANSLSGNMASAARLVLATISEASSTVRFGSWLITDITMLIMIWSRRIFRAPSSRSVSCGCWLRSGISIGPPIRMQPWCPATRGCSPYWMWLDGPGSPHHVRPLSRIAARKQPSAGYALRLPPLDAAMNCMPTPIAELQSECAVLERGRPHVREFEPTHHEHTQPTRKAGQGVRLGTRIRGIGGKRVVGVSWHRLG